jgi:hypothetical protein
MNTVRRAELRKTRRTTANCLSSPVVQTEGARTFRRSGARNPVGPSSAARAAASPGTIHVTSGMDAPLRGLGFRKGVQG